MKPSHSSHNPWRSTKNVDYHITHRTTTTIPYTTQWLCRSSDVIALHQHAVWSQDGKHILWNSGEYGFKDEAALYDNSFQPYGSIWMMNADGTGKRQLTDSHWEDAMPCFVPAPAVAARASE